MSLLESAKSIANEFISELMTAAGGLQLAVISLALAIAWLLHRKWRAYLEKYRSENRTILKRFALRGTVRVVFPLVMLLVILAGRGILRQFEYDTSMLDILAPLLISLAIIRVAVYALRLTFSPGPALRTWEGVISTIAWGVVALHLLGWLPDLVKALDKPAVTMGEFRISFLSVMKFLVSAAVFIILARWISGIIEQKAKRSKYFSASMQIGLAKSSKVILYTVAILIALNSVGIDLTALTVFGGALGVGIGFGLQRIASNFISGFILLFDRSIKPGDVITIGNRFGWVVALHARYIVVRDRDGVETLIPNENLITSEVTNWSYTDRHVRVKLPVQISYQDDPEEAMQIMLEAGKSCKRILENPEPQARLMSFGDNGINLELRVWLDDPENGIGGVRSEVNLAIWKEFRKRGITIPFPQRDVHLVSGADGTPPG